MTKAIIYVHGKNGTAAESRHYEGLLPGFDAIGIEYRSDHPKEGASDLEKEVKRVKSKYKNVILVANSIGAFYCMNAKLNGLIDRAYFISPIVDMEKIIEGMLRSVNATENKLRQRGSIPTPYNETLSWEYLSYVRSHPLSWDIPTDILYGEKDQMTPYETMRAFAEKTGATLTVMKGGEHWFHTDEQMKFLDEWILACQRNLNIKCRKKADSADLARKY